MWCQRRRLSARKLLCPRSVAWFREGDGDTREERRHNIQVNSTLFGPVPSPRWVMLVHHSLLRTRVNPGMIVRRSASRGSVATSEMSHNPRPGILLEVISQKIAHQSIVSPAWPLHTIHHNKMSPVLGIKTISMAASNLQSSFSTNKTFHFMPFSAQKTVTFSPLDCAHISPRQRRSDFSSKKYRIAE